MLLTIKKIASIPKKVGKPADELTTYVSISHIIHVRKTEK